MCGCTARGTRCAARAKCWRHGCCCGTNGDSGGKKASKRELAAQRAHPFPDVRISVVVPVFNTRPKFLRALADSLLAQTHGAWEACLYDGGSTSAETRRALEAIAARDSRFHIAFGAENAGISGNTNRAIKMATGEYIALCDHDDVLAPDVLWRIAEAIDAHHPDVLYTDEDKLTAHGAIHVDAHRKPDFCRTTCAPATISAICR